MTTALVLLGLAAAAGAAVFVLSARAPAAPLEAAEHPTPAPEGEPAAARTEMRVAAGEEEVTARPSESFAYLRRPIHLGGGPLNWKTRLVGFVGLVVLVAVAAAAVAAGLWVLGHVIGHLFGNFFSSSGGTG